MARSGESQYLSGGPPVGMPSALQRRAAAGTPRTAAGVVVLDAITDNTVVEGSSEISGGDGQLTVTSMASMFCLVHRLTESGWCPRSSRATTVPRRQP